MQFRFLNSVPWYFTMVKIQTPKYHGRVRVVGLGLSHPDLNLIPTMIFWGCIFTMVKYHGTEFKTRNCMITRTEMHCMGISNAFSMRTANLHTSPNRLLFWPPETAATVADAILAVTVIIATTLFARQPKHECTFCSSGRRKQLNIANWLLFWQPEI